jgi:hypothetical protein
MAENSETVRGERGGRGRRFVVTRPGRCDPVAPSKKYVDCWNLQVRVLTNKVRMEDYCWKRRK